MYLLNPFGVISGHNQLCVNYLSMILVSWFFFPTFDHLNQISTGNAWPVFLK